MKLAYDLHIHSCLSPCGDMDMTPANIAGMAALNELDVIALTDHGTCRNCEAAMKAGENYGVLVIPGMELTTEEEIHVVCLFPSLEKAMEFDAFAYEKLQKITNRPEIFGRQVIMDEEDEEKGEEPNLLINATNLSFDKVYEAVARFSGVMIPAHIDKRANSLIANLGFIPEDSRFVCAEVKDLSRLAELREQYPYLKGCNIINDSDAHYMDHIHQRICFLEARECSIEAVLEALTNGTGVVYKE